MTAIVTLVCDFCGVEAPETAGSPTSLRERLSSPDRPEDERWEHEGKRDCCPACRNGPEAKRHRTRAVKWLIVHDNRILGHALNRRRAIEAIGRDYGRETGWISAKPRDRSLYPAFRVSPLEEGARNEFAVECPDGVVIHLVDRELVDGYDVELCPCGAEVHYEHKAPRNPIACWIDARPDGSGGIGRYGLYLEGWGWPLKSGDDVEELVEFAVTQRYGPPDVRVPRKAPRLRLVKPRQPSE